MQEKWTLPGCRAMGRGDPGKGLSLASTGLDWPASCALLADFKGSACRGPFLPTQVKLMNRLVSKFTKRRQKPFLQRPHTIGIIAALATAAWSARVWYANR